jgi:26S proteasome regulatory subunit T2
MYCLRIYCIVCIYKTNLTIVFPTTRCKLKLLRAERIKDYLLLEEEFVQNQERLRPREDKHQVCTGLH